MKEKDKKFVSLLYDHYAESLYGIVFRIVGNEEYAKDVMQESFIKVWKKVDNYDEQKARLFTWLLQIFRNTAIDHFRKIKKNNTRNVQNEFQNVHIESHHKTRPETIDLMDNLMRVEEKYRKVLVALYMQEMTQVEASEELEIPLGTVKSRLRIGLSSLRKIYQTLLLIILILSGIS